MAMPRRSSFQTQPTACWVSGPVSPFFSVVFNSFESTTQWAWARIYDRLNGVKPGRPLVRNWRTRRAWSRFVGTQIPSSGSWSATRISGEGLGSAVWESAAGVIHSKLPDTGERTLSADTSTPSSLITGYPRNYGLHRAHGWYGTVCTPNQKCHADALIALFRPRVRRPPRLWLISQTWGKSHWKARAHHQMREPLPPTRIDVGSVNHLQWDGIHVARDVRRPDFGFTRALTCCPKEVSTQFSLAFRPSEDHGLRLMIWLTALVGGSCVRQGQTMRVRRIWYRRTQTGSYRRTGWTRLRPS